MSETARTASLRLAIGVSLHPAKAFLAAATASIELSARGDGTLREHLLGRRVDDFHSLARRDQLSADEKAISHDILRSIWP